jgi:hypothetical protein
MDSLKIGYEAKTLLSIRSSRLADLYGHFLLAGIDHIDAFNSMRYQFNCDLLHRDETAGNYDCDWSPLFR